jgi:hypothetical protein
MVRAVWQPLGISFTVIGNQILSSSRNFVYAGELFLPGKAENYKGSPVDKLFSGKEHSSTSINIYFVNKITETSSKGGRETGGFGIDPFSALNEYKINPGIGVGTKNKRASRIADIIAHEIGHFLRLKHLDERQSNNPLEDTWSKRMLMYPSNDFQVDGNTMVTDVGYGTTIRGSLVTMKDLTDLNNSKNHSTDAEWLTVRTAAINTDLLYVIK